MTYRKTLQALVLAMPGIASDLTNDGTVNSEDLAVLLASWGRCTLSCDADFNSDGEVGGDDLALLLAAYGVCYGEADPEIHRLSWVATDNGEWRPSPWEGREWIVENPGPRQSALWPEVIYDAWDAAVVMKPRR